MDLESSDSLRTFGAAVQGLREHAGLSRAEFGEKVGFSKHTVASIEQGRRMPDPDYVEAAEMATGNTGALRRAARHIARRRGLASWFRLWARMEAEAICLYTYECRSIPGLLQTEGYARALFLNHVPPLDAELIETQLAARLERQRLLRERPNTSFDFILEEHVLLRRTGGEEVTSELADHLIDVAQFRNSELADHLIDVAQFRNVEIQIMPVVREEHAGLQGPIRLLETPEHKWFAYLEGQENGQFVADPKVVSTLQRRYARMRSQALSPSDSLDLLQRMRGSE
ncbi:transcriptional regulator [Streptomyces sp. TS71-3]|nr:helix-turn-helix transcriptional regulator [Streptomyces sp. TS71-3]GHJ36592.1 transcriptional regulator [Streptomyces sp. TS71-3]